MVECMIAIQVSQWDELARSQTSAFYLIANCMTGFNFTIAIAMKNVYHPHTQC